MNSAARLAGCAVGAVVALSCAAGCSRTRRAGAVETSSDAASASASRLDAAHVVAEGVPLHWRIAARENAHVDAAASFGDTLVVLSFDGPAAGFPSRRWSQFVRAPASGTLGIYRQRRGARPDAAEEDRVEFADASSSWALAGGRSSALAAGYLGVDPDIRIALRTITRKRGDDRSWTWVFPRESDLPVRPGLSPLLAPAPADDGADAWVLCARVWRGATAGVRCAGARPGSLGEWHAVDSLAGFDPVGLVATPQGIFLVASREAGDAGVFEYRAQAVGGDGAAQGAARELGRMHYSRLVLATAYGPAVLGRLLEDDRAGGLLGTAVPETMSGAFGPGMTGFATDEGAMLVDAERGLARWSRGGTLGPFERFPAWIWTEISHAAPQAYATPDGVVVITESPHGGGRTLLGYRPMDGDATGL